MSDQRAGKLLVSILGRSLVVVLITDVGVISGLAAGSYHDWSLSKRVPPSPRTMGAEGEGVAEMIIYAIDLAGGAIVGMVIGVLVAVFRPGAAVISRG